MILRNKRTTGETEVELGSGLYELCFPLPWEVVFEPDLMSRLIFPDWENEAQDLPIVVAYTLV